MKKALIILCFLSMFGGHAQAQSLDETLGFIDDKIENLVVDRSSDTLSDGCDSLDYFRDGLDIVFVKSRLNPTGDRYAYSGAVWETVHIVPLADVCEVSVIGQGPWFNLRSCDGKNVINRWQVVHAEDYKEVVNGVTYLRHRTLSPPSYPDPVSAQAWLDRYDTAIATGNLRGSNFRKFTVASYSLEEGNCTTRVQGAQAVKDIERLHLAFQHLVKLVQCEGEPFCIP